MSVNARIVIAAPQSGSGKTMFSVGLMRALKRKNLNIQAFKCGPDYIDPMFHRKILGIYSKNLDLYFTDEETVEELFTDGNEAEISVIEGVMGLYDGVGGVSEDASTYHLAKTLGAPVIFVVNAKGMGRSLLAQISGFLSMDDAKLISGIVLNQTTKQFFEKIKPIVENTLGVSVLGYLPTVREAEIESRYLGLKMPDEIEDILCNVDLLATKIEECVDIDKIVEIANAAKPISSLKYNIIRSAYDCLNEPNDCDLPKIGIAMDGAFCFYYEDNLRLLEKYGARLIPFSPLMDKKAPCDLDGIILGGGYPELFGRELEMNRGMKESLQELFSDNIPCIAECGGFMYLHEKIKTKDGMEYEMLGVIDGECYYTGRLVRFGYMSIEEKQPVFMRDCINQSIKGHEFHYYDSTNNGDSCICTKPMSDIKWDSAKVDENRWMGFAHLYYPSNQEFAKRFVDVCKRYRKEKQLKRADNVND